MANPAGLSPERWRAERLEQVECGFGLRYLSRRVLGGRTNAIMKDERQVLFEAGWRLQAASTCKAIGSSGRALDVALLQRRLRKGPG